MYPQSNYFEEEFQLSEDKLWVLIIDQNELNIPFMGGVENVFGWLGALYERKSSSIYLGG